VFVHVACDLLFFALLYLYLWLVVEPHLIFHGSDRITNFPSFYKTWDYFIFHLSRPGGLVEYVSAFLSQLFCFSWLGALVVAMQAWAFTLLTASLLRGVGLGRLRVISYVPALLLLVLYGRYTYFFPTTMALLCALALASLHVRLTVGRTRMAAVTSFIILSFASYYTAGAAVLLFALTCAIAELLSPNRRWLAGLYVLAAAGLPYLLGVKVFGVDMDNAYSDLLPISWRLLEFAARRRGVEIVYVLYLLVPGVMAVAGGASVLRTGSRRARTPNNGLERRSVRIASPVWRWSVQTLSLVVVAAAVAYGSLDRAQKTRLAVDYCAYHKMWPEVLTEARHTRDDPFVMHAVNRALYHTGQLGDSMFAWPQDPIYLFLTGTEYPWVYWQSYALHLELGFINYAENALIECMAGLGDRPMFLQQLALINMVKGNLDTAGVYLHALNHTLFHSGWARYHLRLLEQDPNLTTDRDVQYLRQVALEKDYPSLGLSPESMLSCLLEKKPANRMVFEYLMAWHLMNRQLTRFITRLESLRDLGYEALPRHYEEAVMVYAATARTTVQLRGYEPREEVRRSMEDFLRTLHRYGRNKQAAQADLAKGYGDTYAFYNVYGPREKTK